MKFKFEQPKPTSQEKLVAAFNSEDVDAIVDALVSAALYETDWRWVQDWCIKMTSYDDKELVQQPSPVLGMWLGFMDS